MLKKSLTALALILTTGSAIAMSASEQEAALIALDDEHKAFSVYTVIIESFGEVKPFTNIINAESGHIAALTNALEAAGVDVPENPYLNGEKARPVAPASVQDACEIGVGAEIANAALYDDELLPMVTGNAELTGIFTTLRDASATKHLPAFQSCAN